MSKSERSVWLPLLYQRFYKKSAKKKWLNDNRPAILNVLKYDELVCLMERITIIGNRNKGLLNCSGA